MRRSFRVGSRVGLRRLTVGVVSGGLLVVTLVGVEAGTAQAVPSPLAYQQFAFGTLASNGGTVTSGPTFPTSITCTTLPGLSTSNGGVVTIPGLINSSSVFQSATTAETGPNNNQVAVTRSTVSSMNLLSGLVTLSGLGVTSTAVNTGTNVLTSGAVSLGALSVLGVPIPLGSIAPNTVVPIPMLGSITLNEQMPVPNGIRTVGAHIRLTAGENAGRDVRIGTTQSGFVPKPPVFLTGVAYSNLIAAGALTVGPLIGQSVPCPSGNSQSSLSGINLPGILTTGSITASGTSVPGNPSVGSSRITLSGVNLLGGLIGATAITSQVNAAKSPGQPAVLNTTGTQFTNLTVGGVAYPDNVAPNTFVPLPGVGYVVLNRQIQTATSVEVRALEVVIQVAGVLPAGSVIRIAGASISATDQGTAPLSAPIDPHDAGASTTGHEGQLCADSPDPAKCLAVNGLL